MGGAVLKLNIRSKILMGFGNFFKSVIPYIFLYKLFALIIMPKNNHKESRLLFVKEAKKLRQKEFIRWYKLTAKSGTYDDNDPIGVLDVTILTNHILKPLLNIEDLRRSERIDFVGGIRGLDELSKRVDSGEMKVAFALYPVSMKQLIDIADSGEIMPPKTTWFEPKLRSGLVIHELD